jgi:hypothetical protein
MANDARARLEAHVARCGKMRVSLPEAVTTWMSESASVERAALGEGPPGEASQAVRLGASREADRKTENAFKGMDDLGMAGAAVIAAAEEHFEAADSARSCSSEEEGSKEGDAHDEESSSGDDDVLAGFEDTIVRPLKETQLGKVSNEILDSVGVSFNW